MIEYFDRHNFFRFDLMIHLHDIISDHQFNSLCGRLTSLVKSFNSFSPENQLEAASYSFLFSFLKWVVLFVNISFLCTKCYLEYSNLEMDIAR